MSKWRSEAALNGRYAVAGIVNSLIGVATIWAFTNLGAPPFLANVVGYAAGLSIGFLTAKKFVFRSDGRVTPEAIRYIASFALSYLVNLLVLYLCILSRLVDLLLAQGLAVSSYVVTMYLSSRLVVFSGRWHEGN